MYYIITRFFGIESSRFRLRDVFDMACKFKTLPLGFPFKSLILVLFPVKKYFEYLSGSVKATIGLDIKLCDPAFKKKKNSTLSMTAWRHTQRCQWYRGVKLSGVNDTAVLDSAVTATPRSLTPRCHWHNRVKMLKTKKI